MENLNTNQEFQLLSAASRIIRSEFQEQNQAWLESPFNWILTLPAGSKGKLGKKLIYQWCALKELSVDRSPDSDADMLINGHRVEIKFSTLWKKGFYRFQQIRDQNYEYSVCLGISPFDAHCWVLSKDVLRQYVIGHMGQHTGRLGKETSWLTVNPSNPLEWIRPYGGTLNEAFVILNKLSRRR
jgi:hypothetical protein